jgi:hypothetical protein
MKKLFYLLLVFQTIIFVGSAKADDIAPMESSGVVDEQSVANDAQNVDVESYNAEGSMFEKIANLEQEKVLMQLEKEKAQLQLDMDRLAAEQARLAREQTSADARAEEQATELEKQKLEIEQEKQKIEEQKQQLADAAAKQASVQTSDEEENLNPLLKASNKPKKSEPVESKDDEEYSIQDKYILKEMVGMGTQLVATVQDTSSGKQKKISVGKTLDGYVVQAISLDDGVELEKDGEIVNLGTGSNNTDESVKTNG